MRYLKKKITILLNALGVTSTQNHHDYTEENPQILYSTCDTLPIKLFYQLLNDPEKVSLLGKGTHQQLNDVWADILDEYWQLSDPNKYKTNIRKSISLIRKRNKYTTVLAGLTLAELGQPSGIETIKHFGYKTVESATQALRVLKTNIALGIAKQESKEVNRAYNLYKDAAILEQILNRQIDLDKVVVTYWIELNKLAKDLNKKKKK